MRIRIIKSDNVSGRIVLPSSKSISNRVLVLNALSGRRDVLPDNVSDCDDTRVMIEWLRKNPDVIDIGAAGTAMRFSTALLAVSDGCRTITGTERMRHRPIGLLVDALRELGAKVDYVENEDYPPLRITGNVSMEGGKIALPGNVSSQYISALLMIAPLLRNGLTLDLVGKIISRPYINLTMKLMSDFGADVRWIGDSTISVLPKRYEHRQYFVESDWSAASYWYEMLALSDCGGEIVLPGLFEESYQGDCKVAEIFKSLGIDTEFITDEDGVASVRLFKTGNICERLEYDFVNQPDLAQTFVVCCCMMNIPFYFVGLQSLKIKETDRILALRTELAKLGYLVGEENDSVLFWNGERTTPMDNPVIDTYEDHRMAMAFAPCALKLGEIMINEPQVVSKSYPKYWDDLLSCGFAIMEDKEC